MCWFIVAPGGLTDRQKFGSGDVAIYFHHRVVPNETTLLEGTFPSSAHIWRKIAMNPSDLNRNDHPFFAQRGGKARPKNKTCFIKI